MYCLINIGDNIFVNKNLTPDHTGGSDIHRYTQNPIMWTQDLQMARVKARGIAAGWVAKPTFGDNTDTKESMILCWSPPKPVLLLNSYDMW